MADIQVMDATEVAAGFRLSQQLAWPHRLEDWALALKLGQGLVIKQQQHTIATALYWQWGEQWASIGLVIVDRDYRNQGLGKLLLANVLNRIQSPLIRLSATKAGEPLYLQLGFQRTGALIQLQVESLPKYPHDKSLSTERFYTASIADLPALLQIEKHSNGMERAALLHELLLNGQVICAGLPIDGIVGFAACHRFGRGYVIGPVYANSLSIAKQLILEHFERLTGQMVRVDCVDLGLGKWLVTLGLQPVDCSTLMQLNQQAGRFKPASPMRQFTLATQAFG